MKKLFQFVFLVACITVVPVLATAATVISHSGLTDPATEGWTRRDIVIYPSGSPDTLVEEGVVDGTTEAWKIATVDSDYMGCRYELALTEDLLAEIANGWEASVTMRIATPSAIPSFNCNFEVASDTHVMSLLFGTDENGSPLVSYLSSWAGYAQTAVDLSALSLDSGYHTYKLSAPAGAQAASLYIDDNFVADLPPLAVNNPVWSKRIIWGDTDRGIPLEVYYSSVTAGLIEEGPIPGDANNDNKVDGSDVTILAGNWQAGVPDGDPENVTWDMGDFNGDGKVDGSDVTILAGNWQAGVTAAAASVPEPSTLMLLLSVSGMALLARYRRR